MFPIRPPDREGGRDGTRPECGPPPGARPGQVPGALAALRGGHDRRGDRGRPRPDAPGRPGAPPSGADESRRTARPRTRDAPNGRGPRRPGKPPGIEGKENSDVVHAQPLADLTDGGHGEEASPHRRASRPALRRLRRSCPRRPRPCRRGSGRSGPPGWPRRRSSPSGLEPDREEPDMAPRAADTVRRGRAGPGSPSVPSRVGRVPHCACRRRVRPLSGHPPRNRAVRRGPRRRQGRDQDAHVRAGRTAGRRRRSGIFIGQGTSDPGEFRRFGGRLPSGPAEHQDRAAQPAHPSRASRPVLVPRALFFPAPALPRSEIRGAGASAGNPRSSGT